LESEIQRIRAELGLIEERISHVEAKDNLYDGIDVSLYNRISEIDIESQTYNERLLNAVGVLKKNQQSIDDEISGVLDRNVSRDDKIRRLSAIVSKKNDELNDIVDDRLSNKINELQQDIKDNAKIINDVLRKLNDTRTVIAGMTEQLEGLASRSDGCILVERITNVTANVIRTVIVPKYWTGQKIGAGVLTAVANHTGTRTFGKYGYPDDSKVEKFINKWNEIVNEKGSWNETMVSSVFSHTNTNRDTWVGELMIFASAVNSEGVDVRFLPKYWEDLTHAMLSDNVSNFDALVKYDVVLPSRYHGVLYAGNTAVAGTYGAISNEANVGNIIGDLGDWVTIPDDSTFSNIAVKPEVEKGLLEVTGLVALNVIANWTGVLAAANKVSELKNEIGADIDAVITQVDDELGLDIGDTLTDVMAVEDVFLSLTNSQPDGAGGIIKGSTELTVDNGNVRIHRYHKLINLTSVNDLDNVGTEVFAHESNLTGNWTSTSRHHLTKGYEFGEASFGGNIVLQWEKWKGIFANVVSERRSTKWFDNQDINNKINFTVDVSLGSGKNILYTRDVSNNIIPLVGYDGVGWKAWYWNGVTWILP
jgi:hypothetical protein